MFRLVLFAAWAVWALWAATLRPSDSSDLRALELELQAARSRGFYVVIDVPSATLSLRLGGVDLKSFSLGSIESGRRLLRGASDDVLMKLLECKATTTRELPVIHPGTPILDEAPVVEPRPPRFLMDCGSDLSLLLSDEASSLRDGIRLSGEPTASVRVRAVLSDEDLARLEAVLPESFLLLFAFR